MIAMGTKPYSSIMRIAVQCREMVAGVGIAPNVPIGRRLMRPMTLTSSLPRITVKNL